MPVAERFEGTHQPVLSWATDLDEHTKEQATQTASLPFLAGHVALMPDAHFGYGSTIGSVIPTKGAIIPSCVGVDIGCGMAAVETTLTSLDLPDNLDELHARFVRAVPAGMGKGHAGDGVAWAAFWDSRVVDLDQSQRATARNQMGTLGGGNHFVEVCLDEDDRVWIVLHSGSRGVGNKLANVHIERAKGLMKEWFIAVPNPDLAYLIEGTPDFDAYIRDMTWAQDYALANREAMLDAVLAETEAFLGLEEIEEGRINCHHNYTERENHRGQNMWVTRKGAIRARAGEQGIIPGSMGAQSFIVTGLGNPASYNSCSHGAGRRMSRRQAGRELDVETLRRSMDGKAWNSAQASELLDEDPRAYKPIDEVMRNQADLVTIDHTLHQILNMKGTK